MWTSYHLALGVNVFQLFESQQWGMARKSAPLCFLCLCSSLVSLVILFSRLLISSSPNRKETKRGPWWRQHAWFNLSPLRSSGSVYTHIPSCAPCCLLGWNQLCVFYPFLQLNSMLSTWASPLGCLIKALTFEWTEWLPLGYRCHKKLLLNYHHFPQIIF